MRLRGGRTGMRAVICEDLELTGLMKPFDLEVWFGDRVGVLGSNGSGKSHFLRLLAGGSDPDVEHRPVDACPSRRSPHGRARLGARVVRAGSRRPTRIPSWLGRTLLDVLWRGDAHRAGHGPRGGDAGAAPLRAGRRRPSSGSRRSPAASRRGCRSCCWSSRAPPCCCWTSRPTTSTWSPPRRWRRPRRRSTAPSSPSPTTAGSPAASTGSWCSARTAGSTSRDEPVWDEGRVERVR